MLRRSHIVVLIAIPVISIVVAWVFCLQENLQQIVQQNIWLEANLQALQEELHPFEKKAENKALRTGKSESEKIQRSPSSESKETITGDSLAETVHIVRAGETLHTIGMKYGIPWTTLVERNHLDRPNTLYVGQELKIPLRLRQG